VAQRISPLRKYFFLKNRIEMIYQSYLKLPLEGIAENETKIDEEYKISKHIALIDSNLVKSIITL
jgi:hypothetical protein